MTAEGGPFYKFGPYTMEPEAYRLWKRSSEISLRPKTFETLRYLVENKGRTVGKEELFKNIWPETHVTESVLTHSIQEAREALGDNPKQPRYIKTIPRAGYRFIAGVEPTSQIKVGHAHETGHEVLWVRRWWQLALLVLVGLLISGLVFQNRSPSSLSEQQIDSIAILPFVNVSEDEESESLCEGIPGSISSSLSRLSQLRVKPTSALLRYKGAGIDPQIVCNEQGVSAVLIGRLERYGTALLVTVDLIDGRDITLIWSRRYSRELSDILAVQEDITQQVTIALRLRLTGREREGLAHSGTKNPEAYYSFLNGQYHGNLYEIRAAVSWFERAIEQDPDYQEAYWEMGYRCFGEARTVTQSEEDYAKARACWEKLVEIDDTTALARQTRADLHWMYDRKWREAEVEYRAAEELDPTFRISVDFLQWMGRRDECFARIERELEDADPFSAYQQAMIGYRFLSYGEYDRAMEQAERIMGLGPQPRVGASPYYFLRAGYEQKGMEKEACEAKLNALRTQGATEDDMEAVRQAFERAGMEGVRLWEQETRQQRPNPNLINTAADYAKQGEKDKAFEWLAKAWNKPLFGYECAPSNPAFDSLRSDPRFAELLRKLNLPEEAIQRHLAL